MSIYAIADLHLSFGTNKPMDIFGQNWGNHWEKIKTDWLNKVTENDLVLLPGDFSWAMYLKDTYDDFKYLNNLPGKKILLKGNHDYWWTTLKSMREYLKENNFNNIDFLYNNSYLFENYIITGTRGWQWNDSEEDYKLLKREMLRLKLSLQDGVTNFGNDKKIIVCTHYPPFNTTKKEELNYIKLMNEYNVEKCIYGHLHGKAHNDAIQGNINGIEFRLVSCDYTDFKLQKII